MNKIDVYNCDKTCLEEFCDNKETHFEKVLVNGLVLHIRLCDKHTRIWEDNFNKLLQKENIK